MPNHSKVQQNINSDNLAQDETIQRCPHDGENPYTMVLNELIRDSSISPNCRWLIMYLLSNKDGWKISIKQVINHLQGQIGRNAVYAIFEEAIKAGYIKKEFRKSGNLNQGCIYYVSERPKFKNIFRHPEFQETETQNPENGHYKKERSKECIYKETGIPEESVFSDKQNDIVSFDPRTYVFKDGTLPTSRTIGSFVKYMRTPEGHTKLLRNIAYYESEIARGYTPKDHEKFLQFCLNKDLGIKLENIQQNDLYARVMKEEHNLHRMEILKTVIQFRKSGEPIPISINKDLPHQTFAAIIDSYIRNENAD